MSEESTQGEAQVTDQGAATQPEPGPEEFLSGLMNDDGSLNEEAVKAAEDKPAEDGADEGKGPERDEATGRFKSTKEQDTEEGAAKDKKASDATDKDTSQDKAKAKDGEGDADTEGAEDETEGYVKPPAGMSAKDREAFYKLPSDQQKWLVEREKQLEGGASRKINEYAERAKVTEPLERVLAPYREKFAHMGARPEQVINQLLTLADHADRDFPGFVREQARLRGIPLEAFGIQQDGEGGQQARDPRLDTALQEIEHLKGIIQQDMQQRQAATFQTLEQAVEEFARDESFPFFDELQADMLPIVAGLRQAHPNMAHKDILARAYKGALSMNEEIAARVEADSRAHEDAERQRKAKEEAARARKMGSGNISGNGALPPGDGISGSDLSKLDDFIGREFERIARA